MMRIMGLLMLVLLNTGALSAATLEDQNAAPAMPVMADIGGLPEDAPLQAYQLRLLDVAFASASAMPLNPHIKDRSRAQQRVVASCLKLDQPRLALRHINGIDNWRRGRGYADLAAYCAERGHTTPVAALLEAAAQIAAAPDLEEWRRHRIQVRIAQVRMLLGEAEDATETARELSASEAAKLASTRAALSDDDAFEAQLAVLDRLAASPDIDIVRNVVDGYTKLYDRHYQHTLRRKHLGDRIVDAAGKMPIFLRIELHLTLAEVSQQHNDQSATLERLHEARLTLDQHDWPLRYYLPLLGRIATLRFDAGQPSEARAELDQALATIEEQIEKVRSFERAEAIRPIAEAYHGIGDRERALTVYATAVAQGAVNPNARPRAHDLSETCCSMAENGFEPDEALFQAIRRIAQGLKQPW
ncbi:MAG: hypothetical protein WD294_09240 [Phycisphaeraceae bacterium]